MKYEIKKTIHSILSSCAYCESAWGKTQILCKKCWENLFRFSSDKKSFYPFFLNSLFVWNEASHLYLNCLIYNLKQGYHLSAMEKIANELFLKFLRKDFWRKEAFKKHTYVFVPSPAKCEGKKDHAWFLAHFLRFKMKGEMKTLLLRGENQGVQKNKDLLERKKISHRLKNPKWYPSDLKTYVFVDDVITTGGTAQAAYKALKKPKNFLVWVIAERPLLKNKEVL